MGEDDKVLSTGITPRITISNATKNMTASNNNTVVTNNTNNDQNTANDQNTENQDSNQDTQSDSQTGGGGSSEGGGGSSSQTSSSSSSHSETMVTDNDGLEDNTLSGSNLSEDSNEDNSSINITEELDEESAPVTGSAIGEKQSIANSFYIFAIITIIFLAILFFVYRRYRYNKDAF